MMKLTEIERKYDVDRTLRVPDLSGLPGISGLDFPGSITLTAVYFDTPNLDLARHHIALRRRDGGADAGWHIKLPAEEGRTELQWPLDTGSGQVPPPVLDPVRAIVRDRPVTPLARITTIRTTVLLLNEAGDAVAELADDDVSASDMRGGVFRKWREWEVELFSAAPDARADRTALLNAIEATLTEAGAAPSTSLAKIARALGARGLGPVAAAFAGSSAASPAATVATSGSKRDIPPGSATAVMASLAHQHAALVAADPAVRSGQPGAARQMLPAVRRLRNILDVYAHVVGADTAPGMLLDLTAVSAVLTDVRQAERRQRRLRRALATLPPLTALPPGEQTEAARDRLTEAAETDRRAAQTRLVDLLTTRQYYGLLDDLDRLLASPAAPRRTSTTAVRAALRAGTARLRDSAALLGTADGPAAVTDAAQRLRHAAEAAIAPTAADGGATKPYRRLAAAARRAERALDATEPPDLIDWLDDVAARPSSDSDDPDTISVPLALLTGVLIGLLSGRAECVDAHRRTDPAALADAVHRCRTRVRKI